VRIFLLPQPIGDTIAEQDSLGLREGQFSVAPQGAVVYTHPSDSRQWTAGEDEDQFRAAAEAWNTKMDELSASDTAQGDRIIEQLRSSLSEIGVLSGAEDSLWDVLLEQTQDGLL
jgi:hypothetical protein